MGCLCVQASSVRSGNVSCYGIVTGRQARLMRTKREPTDSRENLEAMDN